MKMKRDEGLCAWFDNSDLVTAQNVRRNVNSQNPTTTIEESDNKTYYDEYSATLFDKDPMTEKYTKKEYIIWVLADNRIIRFFANPLNKKLYTVVRAYDFPNEFLGKGEPAVIGALQEHASYVWYQLGKAIKRVGQQMAIVGMNSGLSPEQMRTIEDGIFPVVDGNQPGITFQPTMDAQDVEVLSKSFELIDSKIASVTGIGPALQGETIGDVSATEASYVFQNASNRLEMKLQNIQRGMIKEVAEMMFLLCKQSLTQGVTFFDSENKPVTLTADDFAGNYDFIPEGSIVQANRALMQASNQEFASQIIQACEVSKSTSQPIEPVIPRMLLGLLAPYANEADISKYWQPVPPPPPPVPQPAPRFPSQLPIASNQPNSDNLQAAGANTGMSSSLPSAANISPESLSRPPLTGHSTGAVLRRNS
jgi:hypothetical protein